MLQDPRMTIAKYVALAIARFLITALSRVSRGHCCLNASSQRGILLLCRQILKDHIFG